MNTIRDSRAFKVIVEPKEPSYYTTTKEFLSKEECDEIIAYGEKQNLHWGTVYSEDASLKEYSPKYRVVKAAGLPDDEFGWLYDRLAAEVLLINDHFYQYDIRGLYEDIVFLKYTEFEDYGPGKFDWHRDTSGAAIVNRKITTIIQLSDSSDYENCDLYLWENGEIQCTERDKGSLISFPSWVSHRISPITSGTRYSLVTWTTGPPFK